MKKVFLSLAAVVALHATASAQAPTFSPVPAPVVATGGGSCGQATIPQAGPVMGYGYGGYAAPSRPSFFGRLFKKNLPVNNLPAAQGGQLAFPVNPFIRSPRDFFMMD